MINCALIGVGYWGSILKRYIEDSGFFKLTAVCDSKSDLNVVWTNKDIEAVVVATPIETHYAIVKAALLAGKHVFSEKPLALKARECKELRDIALKNGLVLHVDYVFTFSPGLKLIRSLIGDGDRGKLLAVEMNVKHLGRFGRQDVYWLLASHMLSVLDMFCPLKLLDFCFVDLVENETGIIFFDGCLKGIVNVSLNCPVKETKIVFYCEKSTITYDPKKKATVVAVDYEKPTWVVQSKIPQNENLMFTVLEDELLIYAFKSFNDCVIGEEQSNVDLAVKVTEILEKR